MGTLIKDFSEEITIVIIWLFSQIAVSVAVYMIATAIKDVREGRRNKRKERV